VFKAAIRGKINVYLKIMIENQKIEYFLHVFQSNRWFRNGIHSFLRRADARESDDFIYGMRRISLLCGSGVVNDVTK